MKKFNSGKPFHGSRHVTGGKLTGKTCGTDYFYFLCPKCADEQVLRVLEYGVVSEETGNEFNDSANSDAPMSFTLAVHLYCEHCGLEDFVKISNTGQQGGPLDDPRP